MAYSSAVTKEHMYSILQEIYLDYRSIKQAFEHVELQDIDLKKIEYTPKTDSEFNLEARILVLPECSKVYNEKKEKINAEILALPAKKTLLLEQKQEQIDKINANYLSSVAKVEQKALNYGVSNTEILVEELSQLEVEKNDRLATIESEYALNISNIDALILAKQQELEQLEELFNQMMEERIQAKIIELKKEEQTFLTEMLKYNNSIDEKVQRNKNSNISANATLQLKYMEITSKGFSKDELIQRGYYKEIIACIGNFYTYKFNTPLEAYKDFKNETNLMIYLEDYYTSMLDLLRANAEL